MSREVMQQALDAIGSAYREHFAHTQGSTRNELQDAANAIRKELAKPAAGAEPKKYEGRDVWCRAFSEGWNDCREAMLAAAPPAPVVDVEAVRADYERWIKSPPHEHTCDRHSDQSAWPGQYKRYETQLAWEAWQKARAIGDEK